MNLVVDKERMLLLDKMENQSTLSKLVDMEYPHLMTSQFYCDVPADFVGFTQDELKLLIKNASGPDVRNVFNDDGLRKVLYSMVTLMPARVVNALEVDLQQRTVPEGDARPYRYVPGGLLPVLAESAQDPAGWKYTASALGRPASAANTVPHTADAPTSASALPGFTVSAGSDDFTAPKSGTSTHTIFMFCAERWKEAGNIEDTKTLDNIRKRAVEILVPQGLNISTVRTQASRWYQHRQRLVL